MESMAQIRLITVSFNNAVELIILGFDWAVFSCLSWCGGFEAFHGFIGVSATQQEEDKKGGFGVRKNHSALKTNLLGDPPAA